MHTNNQRGRVPPLRTCLRRLSGPTCGIMSLVLLAGCGGGSDGDDDEANVQPDTTAVVSEKAMLINDADAARISEASDGSLIVAQGSALASSLAVGSVLVGDTVGGGYFDVVTATRPQADGSMALDTRPATLLDVYDELETTFTPDFSSLTPAAPLSTGAPANTAGGVLTLGFDNFASADEPLYYSIDGSIDQQFSMSFSTQNGNLTASIDAASLRDIETSLRIASAQAGVDDSMVLSTLTMPGLPLPDLGNLTVDPSLVFSISMNASGPVGLESVLDLSDSSTEDFTAVVALTNGVPSYSDPTLNATASSVTCTDVMTVVPDAGTASMRFSVALIMSINSTPVLTYTQNIGHTIVADGAAGNRVVAQRSLDVGVLAGASLFGGQTDPTNVVEYEEVCTSIGAPSVLISNNADGHLMPRSYAPGDTVSITGEVANLVEVDPDALALQWGFSETALTQNVPILLSQALIEQAVPVNTSLMLPDPTTETEFFVRLLVDDGFGGLQASSDILRGEIGSGGGPVDNAAPIANDMTLEPIFDQDVQIVIPLDVEDPDDGPNPLGITLGTPTAGEVDVWNTTDLEVIYTTPSMGGTFTFTYQVSDGADTSNTATVTITVADTNPPAENQPPQFSNIGTQSIAAGTTAALWQEIWDPDNGPEPLSVAFANVVSGPGSVVITGQGTTILYTAPEGTSGQSAQVDYVVTDGADNSAVISQAITITQ